MHQCRHADVPTYSLAAASNCTAGAPCTNIPLVCKRCNPKPMPVIIYKYSMEQHWSDEHNGIEMDEQTKQDIKLDDNEQKWVPQLLKRKTVKK